MRVGIGDTILYKRKNVITEWEVNKLSPTGIYIAIENDDWDERWIHVRDVLEVIETENGPIPPTTEIDVDAMIEASKQPIPRARTTSTKDFGFKDAV